MFRHTVSMALLIGLFFFPESQAAAAGIPRQALVIGNAAYKVGRLQNPVNDATAVAAALRQTNFDVTLLTDASLREMIEAVRRFGQTIPRGSIALFYYAGHGIQVKGENFLVPVDANIKRESEVEFEAMAAGRVLGVLEEAGASVNLVILDACRDNPFARGWRSLNRGLAIVQAAHGTLLAYATSPGNVASDGQGDHGVYTKYLLQNIGIPGLKVEEVFKRVRIGVMQETSQQQTPWESSSLVGDFYFVPAALDGTSTTEAPSSAVLPSSSPPSSTLPTASLPSPSLPPSTPRSNTEFVTAEGLAVVKHEQVDTAKNQASQDAQRKAIQQVIERSIGPMAMNQHYAQLDKQIYTNAQRYVLRATPVQEWRERNLLKMTVETTLDMNKLTTDLTTLGITPSRSPSGPIRIMVLITETLADRVSPDSAGETAIIRGLLDKGFHVVDAVESQRIRASTEGQRALAGDVEEAQSLGRQHDADVLIIGNSSSQVAMRGGTLGPLISARAHLDARVVETQTASILAASSQEASGVDIASHTAEKMALIKAGEQWLEAHMEELLRWK